MNAWSQTAGVSFVETRGVGKVRISRNQAGYWSYLGTDILHIPTNRPTLNLQGFTMNTDEHENYIVWFVMKPGTRSASRMSTCVRNWLPSSTQKAYDLLPADTGLVSPDGGPAGADPAQPGFDHGTPPTGFDHVLPASRINYAKWSADPGRRQHQRHRPWRSPGGIYPKVAHEAAPSIQAEMGVADEWSPLEDVEVDEELVQ